jgi:hypothetical protein
MRERRQGRSSRSTRVQFLRGVWQHLEGGFIELRALASRRPRQGALQRWFADLEAALAFADLFADKRSGFGVYFGVAKRARRGGRKSDALGVACLWADIDVLERGWDLRTTRRRIEALPEAVRPSALIHSGGGLHAYWFLDRAHFAPAQTSFIEGANAALAQLVSGDAVGNLDRIMRLPGTWNAKRGPKRAERCRVLYCHGDRRFEALTLVRAAKARTPVFADLELPPGKAPPAPGCGAVVPRCSPAPRAGLDALWSHAVRYHAVGPRRIGINAAIAITTARLHCQGLSDRAIVDDVLQRVRRIHAEQAASERWDWRAERIAIRKALERWKPKWKALRGGARTERGGPRTPRRETVGAEAAALMPARVRGAWPRNL